MRRLATPEHPLAGDGVVGHRGLADPLRHREMKVPRGSREVSRMAVPGEWAGWVGDGAYQGSL